METTGVLEWLKYRTPYCASLTSTALQLLIFFQKIISRVTVLPKGIGSFCVEMLFKNHKGGLEMTQDISNFWIGSGPVFPGSDMLTERTVLGTNKQTVDRTRKLPVFGAGV